MIDQLLPLLGAVGGIGAVGIVVKAGRTIGRVEELSRTILRRVNNHSGSISEIVVSHTRLISRVEQVVERLDRMETMFSSDWRGDAKTRNR